MLAPKTLAPEFAEWNRRHKAPYGAAWWRAVRDGPSGLRIWRQRFRMPRVLMKLAGEFGFQENSPTRRFEYPWCYSAAGLKPGMSVVDIGAGASGFQFVLASEGVEVTSVDPLLLPPGKTNWIFTRKEYHKLNRAFGGRVRFVQEFLENAGLPSDSVDRVFSVSVIEHVPADVIGPLMREVRRVLKPGGLFVATIDLFLDVRPFADAAMNEWGSNTDVRALVEASGMEIVVGDRSQLHGYAEFDPARVRGMLDRVMVDGRTLTQCLVLRKK